VSLMLLSIAYIGGIATVPGVIFAGFVLAPGGLAYTAMERWFHLGEYQPVVAGVGVIISAILNPDGVTAAMSGARAGSRRKRRAAAEEISSAAPAPVLAGGPA
jgi:branched-chain amino acid transport system permease protein